MKPGLFSFIGNEFENIFNYSDLFLPGIEKIIGIYYSSVERQLKILTRKKDEALEISDEEILQKRENLVMIQKFRNEMQPFSWIKKADLPFEFPEKTIRITPNLFTELENVILVLRLKNESDLMQDLLLIYFNQNLGNFGLTKSDKALTSDNKIIIGHILYYQFKSFLQMNGANRVLLRTLNNVVRSVINENISLKDQLNQLLASYGENVVSISRQHLQVLAQHYGRNYLLTDEAANKIRDYKGNLKNLPSILENAVIFTENLLLINEEEPVKIQAYSLDFDSYQVLARTEHYSKRIDSRLSRGIQLLDKLERAAKLVKSKNLPLISTKVGQAMEPPVTAPAITDALNKNRNIIRQLIEKYPDKWETVRLEFKPLLNQLRRSNTDFKEIESA
jgi:hypothetical protein